MRLLGGMLRFRVHWPACAIPVGTRLRAFGRAIGWLACLCTAATTIVASALPTATFEESPVPDANLPDEMLIIGSVAGLAAGWTSSLRPLFATTFEQQSADAVSATRGGSNQTGDDSVASFDSQLEFVTIA